MNILDYILLGFILLFSIAGLRKGFLQSLGSIIGIIIGALVASRVYPLAAHWFGDSNTANLMAFVIIFGLIVKVVSLIFWLFGKIFQIITILPFVATFDKLLGFILGIVKAIFIGAIVMNICLKFPINYWMIEQLSGSIIAKTLFDISAIFVPLFPKALKAIKGYL